MSEGSLQQLGHVPVEPASHPQWLPEVTVDLRIMAVALKAVQPFPQAGLHPLGVPLVPARTDIDLSATGQAARGWVFRVRMLEAAPTPCSRTGFHISNSSLWAVAMRRTWQSVRLPRRRWFQLGQLRLAQTSGQ